MASAYNFKIRWNKVSSKNTNPFEMNYMVLQFVLRRLHSILLGVKMKRSICFDFLSPLYYYIERVTIYYQPETTDKHPVFPLLTRNPQSSPLKHCTLTHHLEYAHQQARQPFPLPIRD
ncbi:hypothetical protein RIR_jg33132.t1 [Rhizophagus irregularis DAOM 181602=DAOM 197198]|uniref:Uncharacterized protein n=1 Tax=Rhizophagus irregularis (strain DAOM 181602 / DAOM 197198 / MUCL 43194) TaxID=747089 RepID=U9T882_RHIID|nr:hypothetical protein RIR_jg33132.t1 [Rhizophagus irregularis DAOM 181602=DAOM 197198]CAG8554195.1 15973_t:CDS:2 [Rhizophagus irregularis]